MPTKKWAYTITRYRMREENLVGQTQAPREDYDLLTPILICLGAKQYTELKGLLRMLNLVLLDNVSPESKTKTLKEEFHVQVTPHLEKGVAEMCNLSEGIEKRGEARGQKEYRKNVATNMISRGKYSLEEIAEISGMALEKVREMMDGKMA